MYQDEEDFSTCINCGLCGKVCPTLGDDREKLDIIAAYGKNKRSMLAQSGLNRKLNKLLRRIR